MEIEKQQILVNTYLNKIFEGDIDVYIGSIQGNIIFRKGYITLFEVVFKSNHVIYSSRYIRQPLNDGLGFMFVGNLVTNWFNKKFGTSIESFISLVLSDKPIDGLIHVGVVKNGVTPDEVFNHLKMPYHV